MANSSLTTSRKTMPKTYLNLEDLDGTFFMGTVRIRVLQKHVHPEGSTDMIFIDQKGTTINAKILNTLFERFSQTLKENLIYDVTRFSAPIAMKWNRPTRHMCVMFINHNTDVEKIDAIAHFPIRRTPNYTPLAEVLQMVQRRDDTYLFDVIGVVVYVSAPLSYSSEKLKRVVGIQDNMGTTIKVVLWNEFAADFEKLQIGEKCVLALLSVAVDNFKGSEEEHLMSTKFTQIIQDSDHPCSLELQKGEDYSELESDVTLSDWRENNRKTLFEIVSDFNPSMAEVSYTCVAKITGHGRVNKYLACRNCNTKSPDESGSSYCNRCKMQTPTHYYCRMEATISDSTSAEVVTLFGNQLETIFKMKLPKILATADDTARRSALFGQMLQKPFIFQLRTKVYSTTLSISVYRIGEVVNTSEVVLSKKGKRKNAVLTNDQLQPQTPSKSARRGNNLTGTAAGKKQRANTRQSAQNESASETSYDDDSESDDTEFSLSSDGVSTDPATPNKTVTKRRNVQSGTRKNTKTSARQSAQNESASETSYNDDIEPADAEFNLSGDGVSTDPATPNKTVTKRRNVQSRTRKNAKTSARQCLANKNSAELTSNEDDIAAVEPVKELDRPEE